MRVNRLRHRLLYDVLAVVGIALVTAAVATYILFLPIEKRLSFGRFAEAIPDPVRDKDGVAIECPIALSGADDATEWELIVETGENANLDTRYEIVHITSDRICEIISKEFSREQGGNQRRRSTITESQLDGIQSFVDGWPEYGVHRKFNNAHTMDWSMWLTVRLRVGNQLWVFNTDSTTPRDLGDFLAWLNSEIAEPARQEPHEVASDSDLERLRSYCTWELATWIPRKDVTRELMHEILARHEEPIEFLSLSCTAVNDLSILDCDCCRELNSLDLSNTPIADLSSLPPEVCRRLDRLTIRDTAITAEAIARDWDKLGTIGRIETNVPLPPAPIPVTADAGHWIDSIIKAPKAPASAYHWFME